MYKTAYIHLQNLIFFSTSQTERNFVGNFVQIKKKVKRTQKSKRGKKAQDITLLVPCKERNLNIFPALEN